MTITSRSSDSDILGWLAGLLEGVEDIYLRTPIRQAPLSARLSVDLGIDSLGRINLLYMVIDALGVEASETEAEHWETVADLLQFIRSQLGPDA